MSHWEPSSPLGGRSVATHRRIAAAAAGLAGAVVLVGLLAAFGSGWAAALAAAGTAGLVYAGGIELACRRCGHAVDCASGSFCECRRCGRPIEDA